LSREPDRADLPPEGSASSRPPTRTSVSGGERPSVVHDLPIAADLASRARRRAPARSVLFTCIMVIFNGSWRAIAGRGAVALLVPAVACVWTAPTLRELIVVFGVYALADGVMALGVGLASATQRHRWLLALDGAIGVGFGVTTLAYPPGGLRNLVLLLVIWAMASGVLEVAAAVRMRGETPGDSLLFAAGVISILAGVYALFQTVRRPEDVLVFLAVYAAAFGSALLVLASRVRGLRREALLRPDRA
jgi:uncharacterized membrane protein HdeD (DUF308 family)